MNSPLSAMRFSAVMVIVILTAGCAPSKTVQLGAAAFVPGESELVIHFLNVGAGSCQVAMCPGTDGPIVFDCGSSGGSKTDMSKDDAAEYVQGLLDSDENPTRLVVSHPDADHYNIIPAIFGHSSGIVLEQIVLGGCKSSQECYGTTGLESWLSSMANAGVPIAEAFESGWNNAKEPYPPLSCGDASYVITTGVGSSANSRSMVNLIEYGNTSVLFTGDAEGSTQKSAVATGLIPNPLTLLAACHHGASTHNSNNAAFATATKPGLVVFSAGTKYGHPKASSLSDYVNAGGLYPTASHLIQSSPTGSKVYQQEEITVGEYDTETSGVVVVTVDGQDQPQVSCLGANSGGCGLTPSPAIVAQ